MKSAITLCLVPAARQGPFVFHDGLEAGCRAAAELGFDAIEIFPESAASLSLPEIKSLLTTYNLKLAALGTGAGWLIRKLSLCHADPDVRGGALKFISDIIDAAGELGAPAIIGSMQGKSEGEVDLAEARAYLSTGLAALGERAEQQGQPLLYEPLNRYESNLFNRQADAAAFLTQEQLSQVRLLCDLFHMNMEEADPAAALVAAGALVGHVHWADSNRRAMGMGHTNPRPIVAALREIGYTGYLSAEIFPQPTPWEAARQSVESIRNCTT